MGVGIVILAMFGVGAVLLGAGNRVRSITNVQVRKLWIKYATYFGVVGGVVALSASRWTLFTGLIAIGSMCIGEVVRARAYLAAVWVAVSVVCALNNSHFQAMYLVVAAADGFAQAGGRLMGGPRLWPRTSPQKTLSGAICGVAAAILLGTVLGTGPYTAAALALAGLAGDLAASKVKRSAGIKDFGNALPEHGGFMDRFDSLWGAALLGAILC